MRKYLYAGAVAGGLLLLGAAPAYADTAVPDPAAGQSTSSADGLLGPSGAVNLNDPLSHSRVLNVKPGTNSPDVTGAGGRLLPQGPGGLPAARTGLGQAQDATSSLPPADVVRGVLPGTANTEGLPGGLGGGLSGLPIVGGLLGGGLPVVGGGGLPVGGGGLPVGGGRPIGGGATESGLVPADLPLLGGGLGGLLPFTMPSTAAFDGMPAGGTAVSDAPAAKPAVHHDRATATDARVHEEPVDAENGGRQFSAGRPVSGTDPDFK